MENNENQKPEFWSKSFCCPHCGVVAQQIWRDADFQTIEYFVMDEFYVRSPYYSSLCMNCKNFSIWIDEEMVYPLDLSSPPPHKDMPDDVKKTYEEARQVKPFSSRASAALLRVALEQLTEHLGETEGNLNTRIKNLKKQGLPDGVIKSLDIVRIYANDSVHADAGVIDLENKDTPDIVNELFKLTNIIVEKTIYEKREIEELYADLPEDKKEGIKNRDSNH